MKIRSFYLYTNPNSNVMNKIILSLLLVFIIPACFSQSKKQLKADVLKLSQLLEDCHGSNSSKEKMIFELNSDISVLRKENEELTTSLERTTKNNRELLKENGRLNDSIQSLKLLLIQSTQTKGTTKSGNSPKPQSQTSSSSVSQSKASTSSGRCQAITQKGTQCKRTAQAGRRFCWQH